MQISGRLGYDYLMVGYCGETAVKVHESCHSISTDSSDNMTQNLFWNSVEMDYLVIRVTNMIAATTFKS